MNSHLSRSDLKDIICSDNLGNLKKFMDTFPAQIDEFVDIIYVVYLEHKSLDEKCKGDNRKLFVVAYLFNALNSLLTSFNLLVLGYLIPSGNLMRHYMESILMSLLIAFENLNHDYYVELIEKGNEFRAHKCFDYVEKNLRLLGIEQDVWNNFKEIKNHYNSYSHASLLSLSANMHFDSHNIIIGSEFDIKKEKGYIKEMNLHKSAADNLYSVIKTIEIKWNMNSA